jgi:hypothetical protein
MIEHPPHATLPTLWCCARSYPSLFQNPPGGKRTEEQQAAMQRALLVMGDLYASAIGTTVLQCKVSLHVLACLSPWLSL